MQKNVRSLLILFLINSLYGMEHNYFKNSALEDLVFHYSDSEESDEQSSEELRGSNRHSPESCKYSLDCKAVYETLSQAVNEFDRIQFKNWAYSLQEMSTEDSFSSFMKQRSSLMALLMCRTMKLMNDITPDTVERKAQLKNAMYILRLMFQLPVFRASHWQGNEFLTQLMPKKQEPINGSDESELTSLSYLMQSQTLTRGPKSTKFATPSVEDTRNNAHLYTSKSGKKKNDALAPRKTTIQEHVQKKITKKETAIYQLSRDFIKAVQINDQAKILELLKKEKFDVNLACNEVGEDYYTVFTFCVKYYRNCAKRVTDYQKQIAESKNFLIESQNSIEIAARKKTLSADEVQLNVLLPELEYYKNILSQLCEKGADVNGLYKGHKPLIALAVKDNDLFLGRLLLHHGVTVPQEFIQMIQDADMKVLFEKYKQTDVERKSTIKEQQPSRESSPLSRGRSRTSDRKSKTRTNVSRSRSNQREAVNIHLELRAAIEKCNMEQITKLLNNSSIDINYTYACQEYECNERGQSKLYDHTLLTYIITEYLNVKKNYAAEAKIKLHNQSDDKDKKQTKQPFTVYDEERFNRHNQKMQQAFAIVLLLLEEGANPNVAYKGDKSVLLHAAQSGDIPLITLLVKYSARLWESERWALQRLNESIRDIVKDHMMDNRSVPPSENFLESRSREKDTNFSSLGTYSRGKITPNSRSKSQN